MVASGTKSGKGQTKGGEGKVKEIKKEKKQRPVHPLVGVADKNLFPFKTVPADYQFGTHEPLDKEHFIDKGGWLDYQVQLLTAKLNRMIQARDDWNKTGGTAGKARSKFEKMMEKFMMHKAALAECGLDIDEVMKETEAKLTAKLAAKAAADKAAK